LGRGGTGGALASACRTVDEFGEGLRKVLSAIDPVLPVRWTPGRLPLLVPLPMEVFEAFLRSVLRVCVSPTLMGEEVCDRNAAAAAADESEAFEDRLDRKACAAADAAELLGA
jgi:hypothetical protein